LAPEAVVREVAEETGLHAVGEPRLICVAQVVNPTTIRRAPGELPGPGESAVILMYEVGTGDATRRVTGLASVAQPGIGAAIWLHATDVQAIHDALVADGHTIVSAPIDGPFGRTFTFADPDGYQVTLHDRA
jgi:ADP-ribose pyrophosphatase YjhB (NUDIX family)